MQWLIHVMEAVLLVLIGSLIFSLIRLAKKERNQGIVEVSVSPSRLFRGDKDSLPSTAECIKQLQLFWSTQMLEMRLEGFKPELLQNRSLHLSLLDYLQGASNAVADYFECSQEQRLHLQSYLMTRGMRLAKLDQSTEWLNRLDQMASYENNEVYNAGYQAARQWVHDKTPPKEQSLLKTMNEWGLVA